MNIYKFLTYFIFSMKQKSQSRINFKYLLVKSWKYIQDLTCDLAYIMNQLYRLSWTSGYRLTINVRNINVTTQSQTTWHKVGDVVNLYTYPLLAGSEEEISKCDFTHTGMTGIDGDSKLRNNMFVVYNNKTKYIIHDCDNYMMRNIKIASIDDDKVMIQSFRTHYVIILSINEISAKDSATMKCMMSVCSQYLTYINCIDCGSEAASWISSYLKDSNLRLAYTVPETAQTTLREHIQQLRERSDERNIMMPPYLPVCTLISSSLRKCIGDKLTNSVNSRDFLPNIVISSNSLYDLIEWEWIMIGNTILRNCRPWRRSEIKLDGRNMPVNMILHLLPLQCKLHFSGQVRVGDEVYVKMPIKKAE